MNKSKTEKQTIKRTDDDLSFKIVIFVVLTDLVEGVSLDRVATKMLAPRSMTPADVALFGTYKTNYTWDYGAQRKGRLRYTQAFGAATGTGSTTATVSTDLQYDAWGNATFTNHTFNGAGFTGLTRQFGRRYQVGGREVLTYYRDYVAGGANETTATTDYDARGLPLQVKLSRTGITTQAVAVQTRNVAGLVTKRRTDQLAATGTRANSARSRPGIMRKIRTCSPCFNLVWKPTIFQSVPSALSCRNCTTTA